MAHDPTEHMPLSRSAALFELARSRMILVAAAFMVGFLAASLRLVDLAVLGTSQEAVRVETDSSRLTAAPGLTRGVITDRNGELLATSVRMAGLFADAALIVDPEKTAKGLVKILPDLDGDDVLEKLKSGRRFVWLRRNVTPRQEYAINELGEPGLGFRSEARRIYPHGNLVSHVVGYTDVDGRGLAGIERSFDQQLAQEETIALTIDLRLQHLLHKETQDSVRRFSAKGGMGIIADAINGDILALVSLPDFNPLYPADASANARFNRSTLGVYEMGSTFKIFSIAAALEHGVKFSDHYDAQTPLRIGRFTISDFHAKNRWLSVPEIFIYSSNIGTGKMVTEIGTENLRAIYQAFGLTESLSLPLPEVGRPLVPNPWRDINTVTAAYGHGLAVTPLHVVRAAAAAVNGGMVMDLRLTMDAPPSVPKRAISAQTSERMRELMSLTVVAGSGGQAYVAGYEVGGKTGTAEKIRDGVYDKKAVLSSFLAVFPASQPRYVVLVMLDEPQGTVETHGYATAGWTAAPAVARIIEQMAPLLNLPPQKGAGMEHIRAKFKRYVKELEGNSVATARTGD